MVHHIGTKKESEERKAVARMLIWSSPPWSHSAFGKNSLNLASRLRESKHEVAIFAFTGLRFGTIEYKGITVFPNNAPDHGETYLPIWCDYYKPDVVIQHFDLWSITENYLSNMKDKLPPIYCYPPIDHDPLPPPLARALQGATKVIAMTKFAQNKLNEVDIKSVYIPHAVDTDIYFPGDRTEARKKMNLPEDCFIFLSVATNKGIRKNLGNMLLAYRKFLDAMPEAKKDSILYLHTYIHRDTINPNGYEILDICNYLGITDNVKYTDPEFYRSVGYTEEEMRSLYQAADWSILCSLGEGFCLPLIESLACSTPAIFSNFTALPEVVGPGGLPVEAIESLPLEISNSFQFIPSTQQITKRMIEAHSDWELHNSKLRDELGARGMQHVLDNYDYDVVMPKWLELLK